MSVSANLAAERIRATYPQLTRCIIELAYDNGVVNRFATESEVLAGALPGTTDPVPQADLQAAEAWLSGQALTDQQINDLCCGGTGDNGLPEAFPNVDKLANDVLNMLFDNLCDGLPSR